MRTRPVMALIPSERAVRKVPVIQMVVLYCIFLSSYMLLAIGALLKNHSWKP